MKKTTVKENLTLEEKLDEIINRPDPGRDGEEIVAEILEACSDTIDEIIGEDTGGKNCHKGCDRMRAGGKACWHEIIDIEHSEQRQRKTQSLKGETVDITKEEQDKFNKDWWDNENKKMYEE